MKYLRIIPVLFFLIILLSCQSTSSDLRSLVDDNYRAEMQAKKRDDYNTEILKTDYFNKLNKVTETSITYETLNDFFVKIKTDNKTQYENYLSDNKNLKNAKYCFDQISKNHRILANILLIEVIPNQNNREERLSTSFYYKYPDVLSFRDNCQKEEALSLMLKKSIYESSYQLESDYLTSLIKKEYKIDLNGGFIYNDNNRLAYALFHDQINNFGLYWLDDSFQVIQSDTNGYLLSCLNQINYDSQIIYLNSDQNYVDNFRFKSIAFVVYTGNYEYMSLIGKKKVYGFKQIFFKPSQPLYFITQIHF